MFSSAIIASALAAPQVSIAKKMAPMAAFEDFKSMFGKSYASINEEAKRAAIYADNAKYFEAHNEKYASGASTFYMGVNEYSDLSHDEFKALFIGPKIPLRNATNVEILPRVHKLSGSDASVDWRTKGAVTPVKN